MSASLYYAIVLCLAYIEVEFLGNLKISPPSGCPAFSQWLGWYTRRRADGHRGRERSIASIDSVVAASVLVGTGTVGSLGSLRTGITIIAARLAR
jgi:hypothetical protein